MQQVHRITLWRRRRRAKLRGRPVRRQKGGKEDAYNLNLLAKLLRAYCATLEDPQAAGARISMSVAKTMPGDMTCLVLRDVLLGGSPHPIGALIAAVWDRLTPEAHRRTNKARGRGIATKDNRRLQAFLAKNAGLPNPKETYAIENAAVDALVRSGHNRTQARKLVEAASPRGEGWVREFAEQGNPGTTFRPSDRRACASRWFKITPRMLSYYRGAHNCERIAEEIFNVIDETLRTPAIDRLMAKAARQLINSAGRATPPPVESADRPRCRVSGPASRPS